MSNLTENCMCPIGRPTATGTCQDPKCMYSLGGHCEYRMCCSASSVEDRSERLQAVCTSYQVDESVVRKTVHDISMAVLLNSYFEFLFQKPLLDCRPKEVEELRQSEARYYAWRKKQTPSFHRVLESLDNILPNL